FVAAAGSDLGGSEQKCSAAPADGCIENACSSFGDAATGNRHDGGVPLEGTNDLAHEDLRTAIMAVLHIGDQPSLALSKEPWRTRTSPARRWHVTSWCWLWAEITRGLVAPAWYPAI